MALISNGTTVASGGTVRGSATNLTSLPAPTTSQVLTATAGVTANAVGSYAFIRFANGSADGAIGVGGTMSNSEMRFTNFNLDQPTNTTPSGTWRAMGAQDNSTNQRRTTVGVRIA